VGGLPLDLARAVVHFTRAGEAGGEGGAEQLFRAAQLLLEMETGTAGAAGAAGAGAGAGSGGGGGGGGSSSGSSGDSSGDSGGTGEGSVESVEPSGGGGAGAGPEASAERQRRVKDLLRRAAAGGHDEAYGKLARLLLMARPGAGAAGAAADRAEARAVLAVGARRGNQEAAQLLQLLPDAAGEL
jgi:hypothetical protein